MQGSSNPTQVTLSALNPPIIKTAYFTVGGQYINAGLQGQVANIVYGIGTGMYISSVAQLTAYVKANF